jgi:beta-glucanase (GH16 family)
MKNRWFFLAGLIALLSGSVAKAADWQLVWSDEFDKPGLPDPAKWTYEEGFVRNNELQYYTRGRPENARLENGMLVIESRQEKWPNPAYDPNAKGNSRRSRQFADYTSASLTTRGIVNWRYGRIEVRAKIPHGRGMWPAIWMLGSDRSAGWPACGEIDIMEFVGHDPNTIHGTIHTAKYNHIQQTQKGAKLTTQAPYDDFHIYAIEWNADKIDFFFDDKKYFTYANEKTGVEAWPFDKPHYLILNTAVGGAWGGAQGVDSAIFPQKFLLDYVRVYEPKGAVK